MEPRHLVSHLFVKPNNTYTKHIQRDLRVGSIITKLLCSRQEYSCLSLTVSLSIRWVSPLRQWWCQKPHQPRCHQQPSSRLRRSMRKLRPLPWQTEQETRLCLWWWWCSDLTTNPDSPLSVSEDSSTLYSPLISGSSYDSPVTTSSQHTISPSLTLLKLSTRENTL